MTCLWLMSHYQSHCVRKPAVWPSREEVQMWLRRLLRSHFDMLLSKNSQ